MGKESLLRRVLQTIEHGGVFGPGLVKDPNIWKESLDKAVQSNFLKKLNRSFALPKGASDDVLENIANRMTNAQARGASKAELSNIAESMGLSPRTFTKYPRHMLGTMKDTTASVLTGTRESRLRAMHDFWEGGLLGKGSALRNAITPGEEFFNNISKYKDVIKGNRMLPGVREVGKDAWQTTKAIGKPLFVAGAALPAYGVGKRLLHPDDTTGGGIGRDLGWYAGMTLGIPFGLPGIYAGSEALKRIGGFAGESVGKTIGGGVDLVDALKNTVSSAPQETYHDADF